MKPITAKNFLLGLVALFVGQLAVASLAYTHYFKAQYYNGHIEWWTYLVPTTVFGMMPFDGSGWASAQFLCAILFVTVGYWLTLRRVLTVGLPPTFSLLFFLPIVNVLNTIMLARPQRGQLPYKIEVPETVRISMRAIAYTVVIGVAYTAFSVFVLRSYGASLFLASPIVYGALAGYLANRDGEIGAARTQAVAAMGITVLGGALLLLALEGVFCILMAAPLAYAMAAIGAVIGRGFAKYNNGKAVAMLLVALPVTGVLDRPAPPIKEVTTSIEIAAPPEKVWQFIVDLPEMPAPQELAFRVGIAYPLKAYAIEHRVGAKRVCVFDTGEAIETITALEPEHRLKFHIESQPDQMRETSPYETVHAPHLHGFVESEDGEFVLTRLPNNHTLLTGHSWYRSFIAPGKYWSIYTDHFIHLIHRRVFTQIKHLSEQG